MKVNYTIMIIDKETQTYYIYGVIHTHIRLNIGKIESQPVRTHCLNFWSC